MVTEKAISRELMGKIVDEVFDGAIEDASVIEEIYAAIKRHESLGDAKECVPCGGCGAKTPKERCVGCHHPFVQ